MSYLMHVIAMAPTGSGAQQGNPVLSFLPLIAIIAIMYFLMIRPQAKKQKEHKAMLEAVQKGDRIMTTGGIIGTIAGVKENEGLLVVKIADNVKIEISRSAIAQVLKKRTES